MLADEASRTAGTYEAEGGACVGGGTMRLQTRLTTAGLFTLGPRRRMRTLSRLASTALGLSVVFSLLLAACGSPEPTPTAPATPTAVGAVDDREAWEIEWDELVAAAREEGELVMVGGGAVVAYRPLWKYFGDKFGVEIQSSGGSSRQIVDRILAERSVGRYTIDFFISGLGTSTERLIPNGVLQPIAPLLFLPEVNDLSNWLDNRRIYVDPDQKYVISYAASAGNVLGRARINTNAISQDEARTIHSVWDYLETDWNIVSSPITSAGVSGSYTNLWWHPDAGPEFVEAWFRHPNITWLTDPRTILTGVITGTWDAAITAESSSSGTRELIAAGAPLAAIEDIPGVQENWTDAVILRGQASREIVSAMADPPHPNAQKLLLNWWLSKEGQTQRHLLITASDPSQSLRTDVTEMGNVLPAEQRKEGVKYAFLEETPGYDALKGLDDMRTLWAEISR